MIVLGDAGINFRVDGVTGVVGTRVLLRLFFLDFDRWEPSAFLDEKMIADQTLAEIISIIAETRPEEKGIGIRGSMNGVKQ